MVKQVLRVGFCVSVVLDQGTEVQNPPLSRLVIVSALQKVFFAVWLKCQAVFEVTCRDGPETMVQKA